MTRRRLLILLLAAMAGLGAMIVGRRAVEAAADGSSGGTITVDLRIQLEKGLRARRPVEFRFIEHVLELVDQGTLPRSLVQASFNWARKKPSKRVQYFEFALRALARRRGIQI